MESARPFRLLSSANLLTFSRLVLLPVVVAAIVTDRGWLAVATMVLIWVTDLLDGRLARRRGQASAFGKTLDSAVDFVLIYSLFITFYAAGRLHTYQFVILYLGLVTILALQFSQLGTGGEGLAATRLGKPTGALQYLYLLFLVAREVLPAYPLLPAVDRVLFGALAAAVVLHGLECGMRARRLTIAPPKE